VESLCQLLEFIKGIFIDVHASDFYALRGEKARIGWKT
jgi:hypothetical protein